MELEHHFTVPASVEATWAAFNDPGLVAPCFPGATLISVDGDQFTGSAKIKLGPIALQYNGTGTYIERDEVSGRAVIEARGRDKRGNGTANAMVTAQLRPDGDGTSVHVTTDLAITGKPAQFGRGVMQDVSDKLLQQFVVCLQAKLGGATADGEASPKPEETEPAAQEMKPEAPNAEPTDSDAQPTPRTQAPAYRQASPPAPEADVELNLLSTLGPVLLKRYAAPLLGLLGLIVGFLLGRR